MWAVLERARPAATPLIKCACAFVQPEAVLGCVNWGKMDRDEYQVAAQAVCQRVKRALSSYEDERGSARLDSLIFDVERLHRFLLSSLNKSDNDDVLESVAVGLSILEELSRTQNAECSFGYTSSTIPQCSRGRPKFRIEPDQLEYLLGIGLPCPMIAKILGVSLSTIRRRMSEYGFSITALYSNITDHELDTVVAQIKRDFPDCGYRLMHGHLLGRGLRVYQSRVRDALHQVDPDGVAIRWASTIVRRKYEVFSPLSVWHLDGNHKLIR